MLESAIWQVLNWLPGILLRRFFSVEWLRRHIEIDIRPRHRPVEILNQEPGIVRIWLRVRNDTHFRLDIDRIILKFTYGTELAELTHFRRERLRPHERKELMLTGEIRPAAMESLPFQYARNSSNCWIQVLAECESLHRVRIEERLEGIRPDFLNEGALRSASDRLSVDGN